jgi:hypothetical protein
MAVRVQNVVSNPPPGIQIWVEDLDTESCAETLYFSRSARVHNAVEEAVVGSIDFIAGEGELAEELIYLGVFREVISLDGFLSEGESESRYFGFSASFKVDGREFNQHHSVVQTGAGFSLHLRFLQGHSQLDIEEMEDYLLSLTFERDPKSPIIGENLKVQIPESSIEFKIGNQSHLRVA